jgi:cytochrome c-type biogenesis protein CcmH/NrfG
MRRITGPCTHGTFKTEANAYNIRLMKHCERCYASYADKFKFCPMDGTTLLPGEEFETPPLTVASTRPKLRARKWLAAVLAIVMAAGALLIFTLSRDNQSSEQPQSPPAVSDAPKPDRPTPRVHVSQRRATHPKAPAKPAEETESPDESRNPTSELVQQARVQQLVATGYRRLQQRDYDSAQQAFEEALQIEPHNAAAQKGLNATKTAQSVEGVVGVFRP